MHMLMLFAQSTDEIIDEIVDTLTPIVVDQLVAILNGLLGW